MAEPDERDARPDDLRKKAAALALLIAGIFAERGAASVLHEANDDSNGVLDAIGAWVAGEFAGSTPDVDAVRGRFFGALSTYLTDHSDLTGDAARAYARLVVGAELTNAEILLVQQAVRQGDIKFVERRLGYSATGPCQRCIDLQGVHPSTFPNLYYEHPQGVCSWHPADGAAMAKSKGNPDALRRWYDSGAAAQIKWGSPGDFARCTEIAGKFMSVADARGFCQERHIDATGHPAGHAPGEVKDKGATHAMTVKPEDFVGFDAAAELAAVATTADGMVIRKGKIFEIGDYPDKNFSLTAEEATAAQVEYQPVDLDAGHPTAASQLDGKMGQCTAIEFDGKNIFGTVAIPKWLNDLLGPAALTVSTKWNRATKRLSALSLVRDPRVDDAALMAAFAAASKSDDDADDPATAKGKSDHAMSGMSAAHTMPIQHLHGHEGMAGMHKGDVHSHPDAKTHSHEGGFHDHGPIVQQSHGWSSYSKGNGVMSGIVEFFQKLGKGETVTEDEAKAAFSSVVPEAKPDPEVARLRDEVQKERAKRMLTEAASFADGEVRALRSMPAERASLIQDYLQASNDDAASGPATFANGTTGTRVQALIDREKLRTPHYLNEELLPDGVNAEEITALFNKLKTEGREFLPGVKARSEAELAEKDPEAFRKSKKYEEMSAAFDGAPRTRRQPVSTQN